MPESNASMEHKLAIPEHAFAEIAAATLYGLRYVVDDSNTEICQITASAHDTEQHAHDVWRYNFRARITWNSDDGVTSFKVAVSESNFVWVAVRCQKRCEEILAEITSKASLWLERSSKAKPHNTYGSAAWATRQQLLDAGYLGKDPIQALVDAGCPGKETAPGLPDSTRFLAGRIDSNDLLIPEALTHRHVLICGPTGCGKSSGIFIPNLLERVETSVIVTETTPGAVKPNLYGKTAGWRHRFGQKIYHFNQDDLTSTRVNPLDAVQSFDDAVHIATLVVLNSTLPNNMADQIWQQSETHLLSALIWHVCGFRERRSREGDKANLGYIRALLRQGPESIATHLSNSPQALARAEFIAFVNNTSENFRFGVVSGLMQRLNPWTRPKVAALTAVTDFNPEDLKNQLFSFYLATSIQRPEDKPLAALIFNFVLDLVMQEQLKHPITLLLDEFTNFGYIPAFPDKLTVIRNRKIGAVLGIQDFVQLRKVYGDDDAKLLFTQPGTRIFFRPQDSFTAQKISQELGQSTLHTRKLNSRGHIDEREQPRPLLDVSEVMRIPEDKVIVFLPTTNPAMADRFSWKEHHQATLIQPPSRPEVRVDPNLSAECHRAATKPEWRRQKNQEEQSKADQRKQTSDQQVEANGRQDEPIDRKEEAHGQKGEANDQQGEAGDQQRRPNDRQGQANDRQRQVNDRKDDKAVDKHRDSSDMSNQSYSSEPKPKASLRKDPWDAEQISERASRSGWSDHEMEESEPADDCSADGWTADDWNVGN
jgi:type IV secretion system protein VirD4